MNVGVMGCSILGVGLLIFVLFVNSFIVENVGIVMKNVMYDVKILNEFFVFFIN